MIWITADSGWDMPPEMYAENYFDAMPVPIILGEKEYADGVNVSPEDIYRHVEKTGQLPKTAAASPEAFREFFQKKIENGDEVVHIGLSSGISLLYGNAVEGAKGLKGVRVVDSLSLSSGLALLGLYARDLRDAGAGAAEIVRKLEERKKGIQCSFVIDKLNYLYKGGRCSGLARFMSSVLRIKPTIVMNTHMEVGKKYVGQAFEKAVLKYVGDTFERCPNPDLTRVFITHTVVSPALVDSVKAALSARYKFGEIIEATAKATITSHCGPNTLGILYLTK